MPLNHNNHVVNDLLFSVAVSTSYGFGVFDLVRSQVVHTAAVTVPSGELSRGFIILLHLFCFNYDRVW